MQYDLIVLGAGPAGYFAAERAGKAGLETLLIEKEFLGGVCLNVGCIPTKTLLNSAKLYEKTKTGSEYGVEVGEVNFNHGQVLKRKEKVVNRLVQGVKAGLKRAGVNIVEEEGYIQGTNGGPFRIKAGVNEYRGQNLLIATGSKPVFPPISGLEKARAEGFVLTSRESLDLSEVPESLVVIGGGYIGLEMASYFNAAGSRVTVVEMLDHIGGEIDRDIGRVLMQSCQDKGIEFKLNSQVVEIEDSKVVFEEESGRHSLTADRALLAVGRSPVISGFGLENLNLNTEQGSIEVDERGQTSVPGVYAAGDVNGRSLLAHTAYREADVCVNNILNKDDVMRYEAVPSVIYTSPEVAAAGLTTRQAQKRGLDYREVELPLAYSGRYVAENRELKGKAKLLIENEYNRLIGVHLIGSYVSEIIYGAGMMIDRELRVEDIKEVIFPHPTVSEIIREGVFQF